MIEFRLEAPTLVTSDPTRAHFVGYHDIDPLNAAADRVLCHRAPFDGRLFQAGEGVDVGFWSLSEGRFTKVGSTEAVNWQQGARLRWVDGEHLAFNTVRDGVVTNVICDSHGCVQAQIPVAVYDVHVPTGLRTALDFGALNELRPGYGYFADRWGTGREIRVVEADGAIVQRIDAPDGIEFLDQPIFSPSGKKIAMLGRSMGAAGQLLSVGLVAEVGASATPQAWLSTGRMSHFAWVDDDRLVAWGSKPTVANALRKHRVPAPIGRLARRVVSRPGIRGALYGECYVVVGGENRNVTAIQPELTSFGDGHMHTVDGRVWVSDTYDDGDFIRRLFVWTIGKRETCALVAEVPSLGEFSAQPFRCDLHPRLSSRGIVIDTLAFGRLRQVALVDTDRALRALAAF